MNAGVIAALVRRYLYLYTRSWVRAVELVFWPAVDLLVWGYLTVFLQRHGAGAFPQFITFLIGAMILWDVLFRAQQGVAMSLLEDVWTRNVINVFVAPVRVGEYLAATFSVGLIRVAITVVLLGVLAMMVYGFNLLAIGLPLVPFFANLLLFGWSLGMISTALIIRWGPAAESLAWAIPFLIQPVGAVFYPVDVLPMPLQIVARMLPCSYIFEGMREVLRDGRIASGSLAVATGLNLLFMGMAGWVFLSVMRTARERGLLAKLVN